MSTDPVLVAFATEHGSTGEIAEAVAETLRDAGLEVDLMRAARVRSLDGYRARRDRRRDPRSAVCIPDAQQLLRRCRDDLASLQLAVFGVGSRTTEPSNLEACRRQLDAALAKVPEAQPFAVTVFGGVLDPAELRSPFNPLPAVDARDWFAIRTWAALVGIARCDAVPAAALAEAAERRLDEVGQRLEVVAALEHRGDARRERGRAAGELLEERRSRARAAASGSSTWASNPAETSSSSGSNAATARSARSNAAR